MISQQKLSVWGLILILTLNSTAGHSSPSSAAPQERASYQQHNLSTTDEADAFADRLISEARKERELYQEALPIHISHLGPVLPEPLKWLILRLEKEEIPLKIELITQKKLEDALKKAEAPALKMAELADYTPTTVEKSQSKVKQIFGNVGLFVRKLFKLPNGLSLIFKLKRGFWKKLSEGALATGVSASAAVSVYATTYVFLQQNPEASANLIAPAIIFPAWVWFNLYFNRGLMQIFNQVKAAKINDKNEVKIEPNHSFIFLAELSRSLISNAILLGSTFGLSHLLQFDSFHRVFVNSAIYIFGRSWVDRLLYMRMPTQDAPNSDEATQNPEAVKKWGFWKWFVTFTLFDAGIAFLKNLNVIGFEGLTTYLYTGIGLLGVTLTLWNERGHITDWMKSLFVSKAEKLAQTQSCQTYITKVSPVPKPVQ